MRILTASQFQACTADQRRAMQTWFDDHGIDWRPGTIVLEQRCGVVLLCLRHLADGTVDWRPTADGGVVPQRPHSVISEAPFPWPAADA